MAKTKSERKPKVTTRVIKGRMKVVSASVDGEPVVNVVKLTSGKQEAFVTTDPSKDTVREVKKSGRLHTTERSALNRYRRVTRRFPQITPRVKRLL